MIPIIDWGGLRRALKEPIGMRLKRLLMQRRDQLAEFKDLSEIARFVIVQSGDSLDALEMELGFSVFRNPVDGRLFGDPEFTPGWEWIADHGHCFEFVFIYDDSGFGHVVIVPKQRAMNAELITLCSQYASNQP